MTRSGDTPRVEARGPDAGQNNRLSDPESKLGDILGGIRTGPYYATESCTLLCGELLKDLVDSNI